MTSLKVLQNGGDSSFNVIPIDNEVRNSLALSLKQHARSKENQRLTRYASRTNESPRGRPANHESYDSLGSSR